MSTVWTKPDAPADPVTPAAVMLHRTLATHHPRLREAEVRVGLVFAVNADGPALKFARRPAAAIARILPTKLRLLTGLDALVEVDGTVWESLEEESRWALLDHELRHLAVIDRPGNAGRTAVALDDLGRPRLKIDLGDFYVGDGFVDVIERHGLAALEVGPVREAHALILAHLPDLFSARAGSLPDTNGTGERNGD
jgi:hypothetical protein